MITFSQGEAAKIKSKQFLEFGSRTKKSAALQILTTVGCLHDNFFLSRNSLSMRPTVTVYLYPMLMKMCESKKVSCFKSLKKLWHKIHQVTAMRLAVRGQLCWALVFEIWEMPKILRTVT